MLREGNVFTGVCLSHRRWGEGTHPPPGWVLTPPGMGTPIHGPKILGDTVDKGRYAPIGMLSS